MKYILIAFSFLLFIQTHLTAQTTTVSIVDTIKVKGKQAILFANNSWQYLDDYTKMIEKLNSEIITSYWDTENIHAYRTYPGEKKYFDFTQLDSANFTMPKFKKFFRGLSSGHTGTDLGLTLGDSVVAMFDGKVRYAKYHTGGYGYLVIIRHPNGLETWYSHLSRLHVETNDIVKSGQLIGAGGMTGRASSPHLHLEVRYLDRVYDAAKFIDFEKHQLKTKNSAAPAVVTAHQTTTTPAAPKVIKSKVHKIVSGDTLYSIARNYNTTVDALCKANNMSRNQVLHLGKTIRIP